MSSNPFDEPLLKPEVDYSSLFENWEDKIAYPVKTFKDGLTYSVPTFLSFFKGGNLFFRWMNREKNHRGFQYKEGLNVDTLKFKPSGSCKRGGLYFASLSTIEKWRGVGGSLHLIALPSYEKVYVDGRDKFKVHSFILGPEIDYEKLIYNLVEQEFPFERLSVRFDDKNDIIRDYQFKKNKIVKGLWIYKREKYKLSILNSLHISIDEAFKDYTFVDCKFCNLNIIDYDFEEAKLENCNFYNCDLTLSDLSKIQGSIEFKDCNLLYTKYDEEKHQVVGKSRF